MTAAQFAAVGDTALIAAEGVDIGAPPIMWGVGTLVFFMVLLAMTLAFGKGRG